MESIKKIFILLGSLDRRIIFLIVGLSVLIPLLKKNISLQIKAGAEVVMILDSGLDDISTLNLEIYLRSYYLLFDSKLVELLYY